VYYRDQRSVVLFLWAKGLNAKNNHKEMFPVYGGKCLLRRAVHNWVDKFSQGSSKVADDAKRGAEVDETTIKNFYSDGTSVSIFAENMLRNKCFFSRFEYHIFYVLHHL
jgi:hypothetical protein